MSFHRQGNTIPYTCGQGGATHFQLECGLTRWGCNFKMYTVKSEWVSKCNSTDWIVVEGNWTFIIRVTRILHEDHDASALRLGDAYLSLYRTHCKPLQVDIYWLSENIARYNTCTVDLRLASAAGFDLRLRHGDPFKNFNLKLSVLITKRYVLYTADTAKRWPRDRWYSLI